MSPTRTRIIVLLLMAFATAIAAAFFIPQSLRLDEAQTLWQVSRFPNEIFHVIGSDVHVPLYHFLLFAWNSFFGNGITVDRIFSLVFFLASIPMMVIVGDETYGSRRIGTFGAVLLALSPFMNWYASEIRMYTMLVFMTLVSQYFFIRFRKTGSNAAWWGYLVTGMIGAYVHYFFGLVLIAQAIFFIFFRHEFRPGSMRRLLLAYAIVLLALAPWAIYVLTLGQASNSVPLLPVPSLINLFNTFSEFLIGEQSVPINAFVVALWPLIMLAWFLTFQKRGQRGPDHASLLFLLLLPIGIAFAVSVLYKPVYLERYLIFAASAFYLMLSAMIDAYPRKLANALRIAFAGAMLAMIYVLAVNPATPVKENYAAAAQYLTQYGKPSDIAIVSAPFTVYPLEYYYNGPVAIDTLPLWDQYAEGPVPPFATSTFPSEVQQIAGDHARLWLLLSYNQGYQPAVQSYFDSHYRRLDAYTLSPGMVLELYQLRYDVATATVAAAQ